MGLFDSELKEVCIYWTVTHYHLYPSDPRTTAPLTYAYHWSVDNTRRKMINSALSRSFIALTGLLTSEQTRDKCLLKTFQRQKRGLKKVKKMLLLFFFCCYCCFLSSVFNIPKKNHLNYKIRFLARFQIRVFEEHIQNQ